MPRAFSPPYGLLPPEEKVLRGIEPDLRTIEYFSIFLCQYFLVIQISRNLKQKKGNYKISNIKVFSKHIFFFYYLLITSLW